MDRIQGTGLRLGESNKALAELEEIERKAAKVTRGTVGLEGTEAVELEWSWEDRGAGKRVDGHSAMR